MRELPREGEILTYCAVGQRSYYAVRLLRQHGFNARTISGGFRTYSTYRKLDMKETCR
jgi:rhodanese-related sulfurtransferase